MASLHCDISGEVSLTAERLQDHFTSILRAKGVERWTIDICDIEDILKTSLPLEELFSLREAIKIAIGASHVEEKEEGEDDENQDSGQLAFIRLALGKLTDGERSVLLNELRHELLDIADIQDDASDVVVVESDVLTFFGQVLDDLSHDERVGVLGLLESLDEAEQPIHPECQVQDCSVCGEADNEIIRSGILDSVRLMLDMLSGEQLGELRKSIDKQCELLSRQRDALEPNEAQHQQPWLCREWHCTCGIAPSFTDRAVTRFDCQCGMRMRHVKDLTTAPGWRAWRCDCGVPPVTTDSIENSWRCPECGGPMSPMRVGQMPPIPTGGQSKVWNCDCGVAPVLTACDKESRECPECGHPMTPEASCLCPHDYTGIR